MKCSERFEEEKQDPNMKEASDQTVTEKSRSISPASRDLIVKNAELELKKLGRFKSIFAKDFIE